MGSWLPRVHNWPTCLRLELCIAGCMVKITNYRKNGDPFNNMLTLRPLCDREGHMIFGVSINVEVIDSFERLKPLLMQADCLLKLIPDRIALPAPRSVHERVSLVHDGLKAARADFRTSQARASAHAATVRAEETRNLQTAAEKATALASARATAYRRAQRSGGAAMVAPDEARHTATTKQLPSRAQSPRAERAQSPRAERSMGPLGHRLPPNSRVAAPAPAASLLPERRPTSARASSSAATPYAAKQLLSVGWRPGSHPPHLSVGRLHLHSY